MLVILRILLKNVKKHRRGRGQKWAKNCTQYFFTPGVNKYLHFPLGSILARLGALLGPPNFASWRVLAASWTDFIFFFRPLDASWARPGVVQDPPEASPEALGGFLYW